MYHPSLRMMPEVGVVEKKTLSSVTAQGGCGYSGKEE